MDLVPLLDTLIARWDARIAALSHVARADTAEHIRDDLRFLRDSLAKAQAESAPASPEQAIAPPDGVPTGRYVLRAASGVVRLRGTLREVQAAYYRTTGGKSFVAPVFRPDDLSVEHECFQLDYASVAGLLDAKDRPAEQPTETLRVVSATRTGRRVSSRFSSDRLEEYLVCVQDPLVPCLNDAHFLCVRACSELGRNTLPSPVLFALIRAEPPLTTAWQAEDYPRALFFRRSEPDEITSCLRAMPFIGPLARERVHDALDRLGEYRDSTTTDKQDQSAGTP